MSQYTFPQVAVGLVGAGSQKSGLNLKIPPKYLVLALLDLPPKEVSTF